VGEKVPNWNPYFIWPVDFPDLDIWYLVVWYVFPHDYVWNWWQGWVYSSDSLEKVSGLNIADFKFLPSSTVATHRTLFHRANSSNTIQQMYDPRFEEIPASKVGDVSDLLPVRVN